MDTKVIPLIDLQADTEGILSRCYDSGQSLVVELPNQGLVSIQPVESDDDMVDDLIEHNPRFRALLERSLASRREPFPFADPEEHPGPRVPGPDGASGRQRQGGLTSSKKPPRERGESLLVTRSVDSERKTKVQV
jgi:hypothetical protein